MYDEHLLTSLCLCILLSLHLVDIRVVGAISNFTIIDRKGRNKIYVQKCISSTINVINMSNIR